MSPTKAELIAEVLGTGTLRGLPSGHFIGGQFVDAASGATMECFDPGTGAVFARFAAGDADDVDRAVSDAARALTGEWQRATPAERGRVLGRTAELIRQHADGLAVAEALDSGKRLVEAEADVRSAARAFEYYAGAADKLEGISLPLGPDHVGMTIEEPVGVAVQIVPWNYPLSTAARGVAAALAAGCTTIAKPAEQTPFSTLLLAELAFAAGLPAGAFNVVTGTGRQAGAALVSHPGVNHITFTGSVPTGINVMQQAARNVTRVVLELGGKSPLAVLADCDIDTALNGVIEAIYENAGQICSAGSRLVLERSISENFIDRLVGRVGKLTLGHGLRNPDVGPVNSRSQLEKIERHVAAARAAGNAVLAGGAVAHPSNSGSGWFFEPTIIAARAFDDPIVQEEIFGPVLTVQIVDDLDEAIAAANCTDYALVAGIYTRDFSKAYRFARAVDAGQVYINEFFAGGIQAPFGGNRKSGFGRAKGMEGLKSYCKLKTIVARI